jgi:hypothetical protein
MKIWSIKAIYFTRLLILKKFNLHQNGIPEFVKPYIATNPTLVCISDYKKKIPLKDDIPINKKPYPIPLYHMKNIKDEINKLLEMNIVQPSTSTYASSAF